MEKLVFKLLIQFALNRRYESFLKAVNPSTETAKVRSEENNAQQRTALSFLKKKASNPPNRGININRSGIMNSIKKSKIKKLILQLTTYFRRKNCNTKNKTMLTTISNT